MRHHRLIPALEIIESSLFETFEQAQPEWPEPPAPDAIADAALPAWIAEVIARRVSALPLAPVPTPSPGELWWARLDAGADRPVAMLLRERAPDEVHGWLVSSEVAYAGDWDWVLQDDDVHGTLDPRLGMVQLWHRVRLPAARLDVIVAVLRAEIFEALCKAAEAPPAPSGVAPAPGRIGLTEHRGVSFVSGTPLGAMQHDPRHAYRALYRKFAEALQRDRAEPTKPTGP